MYPGDVSRSVHSFRRIHKRQLLDTRVTLLRVLPHLALHCCTLLAIEIELSVIKGRNKQVVEKEWKQVFTITAVLFSLFSIF
jgi:hypothetical protein